MTDGFQGMTLNLWFSYAHMYTHIHTTNTHTLKKRASHARMTKVVVKDYSIKPSSLPLGNMWEGRGGEVGGDCV